MEQQINQAFAKMIATYRCHVKLGITANHVRLLRYQVKRGITISLDKKHRLLKRWGWKPDAAKYTDQDIIDIIKFTIKTGTQAKQLGAGYILEKWTRAKK